MPPTNNDYAKINIACKALNLDKSQLISDRYNKESSKLLTRAELSDLYDHFAHLGWRPKYKSSKKTKASPTYRRADQRKVVALWITLAQAGIVKNRSDKALQTYVKRMANVANLAWCDSNDCRILIEALKAWADREDVDVSY